ncbi:MAG: AMP-binding protein, partial [Acidobacteriota bacterium]
ARRLVLGRVARRVVGDRLQRAICVGGPTAPMIDLFYEALGLPLLHGYGLSEAAPLLTLATRRDRRPGAVGRPLDGVALRIADDGEILVRGDGVMRGYWQDAAATAAVKDADGWLHTGDLGRIDAEGHLHVTGRRADVFTLADGTAIAPLAIEVRLTAQPGVRQAVLVGDGRPYPIALLVPDRRQLRAMRAADARASPDADADASDGATDAPSAIDDAFHAARRAVNLELPAARRIVDVLVVPAPFSVEAGTLSPHGAPRRQVILRHWTDAIDARYAAPSAASAHAPAPEPAASASTPTSTDAVPASTPSTDEEPTAS